MSSPLRSIERRTAASLRAVAHEPAAEIRGTRLEVDHRPVGIVVPYLSLDFGTADVSGGEVAGETTDVRRGVADALALRLRHSDRELHLHLTPTVPVERIVFDICEQFRCEVLADPSLRGLRANIDTAFDRWSDHALGNGIGDTGTGLVIFTITHMLRARLLRTLAKENVDDLIEGTRANLGRLVGHALRELPRLVGDQRAYAEPARELARLIGEMLDDATMGGRQSESAVERNRLLVPVNWETLEDELTANAGGSATGAALDDYAVYSKAHDIVVDGRDLYRPFILNRLRTDLDRAVADQAVSVTRLAQRLGPLFLRPSSGGSAGGRDHGVIDRARLAQVVADPLNPYVHALPVPQPTTDAAVTFLVDTTGSMKVQQYEAVAVLCDTMVRALEMIGVQSEVLGFSTATWAGGESLKQWQRHGSPAHPGRLADTLHIVYKSFDRSWRQSRSSLAAMLKLEHYREGVDGEAVQWAAERLAAIEATDRYMVLVSDGQPMEATTATHNRDDYLLDHLRRTVECIEAEGRLRFGAVSVDYTIAEVVTNATLADLSGTLTLSSYGILHRLFG